MADPFPSAREDGSRSTPARHKGEEASNQYTQAHVRFPYEISNHPSASASHVPVGVPERAPGGTSQAEVIHNPQDPVYPNSRFSAQKDLSGTRLSHPIELGLGHPRRGGQNDLLGAHRVRSPQHSRLVDYQNEVETSEYISSLDHSFASGTMSPDVSGIIGEPLSEEHGTST